MNEKEKVSKREPMPSLDTGFVRLTIRTSSKHKCEVCKIRIFVALITGVVSRFLCHSHFLSSQYSIPSPTLLSAKNQRTQLQ